MGRADPVMNEQAFTALLGYVHDSACVIAGAARATADESASDEDIAQALFLTRFRLPYGPYEEYVNAIVDDDCVALAHAGFSDEALDALRPVLASAYSAGVLLGWELRRGLTRRG